MVQTNTTSQTTLGKKPQVGDGEFIQLRSRVSRCSHVADKRHGQITSLGIRCMAWLRHVAPCIYSLIYTPVGEIQRKRMEKGQKKEKSTWTKTRGETDIN